MLYAATLLGVIPPVGLAASSAPCGVRLVLSAAEGPPLSSALGPAAHELLSRCRPLAAHLPPPPVECGGLTAGGRLAAAVCRPDLAGRAACSPHSLSARAKARQCSSRLFVGLKAHASTGGSAGLSCPERSRREPCERKTVRSTFRCAGSLAACGRFFAERRARLSRQYAPARISRSCARVVSLAMALCGGIPCASKVRSDT